MKPPYDPPREAMLIAVAEAIDAWAKVERQAMLLLGNLRRTTDPNVVWAQWHSTTDGTKQWGMINDAVKKAPLSATTRKSVFALLGDVKNARATRNQIVHGQWREMHHVEEDEVTGEERVVRIEMYREHGRPGAPFGATPGSDEEVEALRRRRVHFYLDDLRAAEVQFRKVLGGIIDAQALVLGELLPRLR